MKRVGQLLSVLVVFLLVSSVVIIMGGLFDRPLLLAAVPTGSMTPVLRPGDLIVVLPTWAAPDVKVGDIVVYRTARESRWIVHRVIKGDAAQGFVIKGDANPTADPGLVFPQDIAGVVPQRDGKAFRMPRLGMLSLNQGPLSSPVVAGVALAMGIYLITVDLRPSVKLGRLRLRYAGRIQTGAVATMYVGLAGTVFLSTLIPAWMLSTRQPLAYEVIREHASNVTFKNKFVVGQPHDEEIVVNNPSPIPILVVYSTSDSNVTFVPSRVIVPPKGSVTVTSRISGPKPGKFQAVLNTGVFLPLLPGAFVALVASRSVLLAATLTAAVPTSLVILLAFFDERSRKMLYMWRMRVRARFL